MGPKLFLYLLVIIHYYKGHSNYRSLLMYLMKLITTKNKLDRFVEKTTFVLYIYHPLIDPRFCVKTFRANQPMKKRLSTCKISRSVDRRYGTKKKNFFKECQNNLILGRKKKLFLLCSKISNFSRNFTKISQKFRAQKFPSLGNLCEFFSNFFEST